MRFDWNGTTSQFVFSAQLRLETPHTAEKSGPQKDGFKLFDATAPVSHSGSWLCLLTFTETKWKFWKQHMFLLTWFIYTGTVTQAHPILADLVPPFPQPANTEDAIIEVLKYSQKDMDAAIARVQAQVCPAQCFMIWQITEVFHLKSLCLGLYEYRTFVQTKTTTLDLVDSAVSVVFKTIPGAVQSNLMQPQQRCILD